MKWPAVICISAGIAIGTVQLMGCKTRQTVIKQHMVQVIEIGDHPPREYVIWEADK